MSDAVLATALVLASVIAPREDCEEIRGTPYRETVWELEREWFLKNCTREQTITYAVSFSGSEIERLICSYPWPCEEALYVGEKESGLNPVAINKSSGACSIMQTLPCVGYDDINVHLDEAYRKWLACNGGSFQCAWYAYW